MEDLKVDALVAAYVKLRDRIRAEEEQHEQAMKALQGELDVLSQGLLDHCNAHNMDSIRTPVGTVSRRVQTRYWPSDWEAMHQFVKEHDALNLLERRISQGNMKQFLEENPDLMPPGLQSDHKYVITVRKPNAK